MLLNIPLILRDLAKRRPVFHSEADFQHEFAIALRQSEPTADLRLEVPFAFEKRGSTDIVVRFRSCCIGIELKYLTRKLEHEFAGEVFKLKAHGATDLKRYDILKDVQRLERFNEEFGGPSYAIALTNDPAYWKPTTRTGTIDAAFRLCHGREVSGECQWADHAALGSIKNREFPLLSAGNYKLDWQPYSDLQVPKGQFRYLLLPIS